MTKKFVIFKRSPKRYCFNCKGNKNGFYDKIVVFIFNFLSKYYNGSLLTSSRLVCYGLYVRISVLKSISTGLVTSES